MISRGCRQFATQIASMLICAGLAHSPAYAIVGGTPVKAGEHPYVVAIVKSTTAAGQESTGYMCSGSLIATQWVLTSAECVRDIDGKYFTFDVVVGSRGIHGGDRIRIETVWTHPDYNIVTGANSIALAKLRREPMPGAQATTVALGIIPDALTSISVLGFGQNTFYPPQKPDDAKIRRDLHLLHTQLIPEAECRSKLLNYNLSFMEDWLVLLGMSANEINQFKALLLQEKFEVIAPNSFCAENSAPTPRMEVLPKSMIEILPTPGIDSVAPRANPGPCADDTGGPAVVRRPSGAIVQIGIISFGLRYNRNFRHSDLCGDPILPAIYISLAPYLKWITSRLGNAAGFRHAGE